MFKAGIIDPAKVTRSALQNAASIAGLFLTTEAVVADKPEKEKAPAAPAGGGDMDYRDSAKPASRCTNGRAPGGARPFAATNFRLSAPSFRMVGGGTACRSRRGSGRAVCCWMEAHSTSGAPPIQPAE